MARKFANLPYGPHELRPLLRAVRRPGERLIAWGAAQEVSTLNDALGFVLRACTAVLPGAWGLIEVVVPAALRVRRWCLVLTDRRLLLLPPDRRVLAGGGRALLADHALPSLAVDTPRTLAARAGAGVPDDRPMGAGLDTFRLWPRAQPPVWVRVPGAEDERGGVARLAEALRLLAGEADALRAAAGGVVG